MGASAGGSSRPQDAECAGAAISANVARVLSPDATAALVAENAALRHEVGEVRRRLGKDSFNSSKPPFSDGPARKPRCASSRRGHSGKKSGGHSRLRGDTLRPVANPDKIERHEVMRCGLCQAGLTASMAMLVEKRQVIQRPRPRQEVTERQVPIRTCACCRGETLAAFPAYVSPIYDTATIRPAPARGADLSERAAPDP